MDEAKALLKAICDNPDDDTARLVYADWLDEHGDSPRAEFIRVQVELARMEGDDPRRPALARREGDLWEVGLAQPEVPRGMVALSHGRGFLAWVDANEEFAKSAGELFAEHPVTAVWLYGEERPLRAAARCPRLARVRDLGVRFGHPPAVAHLLRSQFATGVRGLHLQDLREGVPTRLEDLRDTRLGDFFPLLDVPHLGGLTRLSLSFDAANAGEVRQFTRLKLLCGLTELTLCANVLGDTTARELAAAPALAGLRSLRLYGPPLDGTWLGDEGVRHLAESPHLAGLRRLSLYYAKRVTDDGLRTLARSPHLRNLTDLDLGFTSVTRRGVKALVQSPNLPRLSRLVLNGTPAGGRGARFDNWATWYAFPPDDVPGVLWVSELRRA